jgi:hypothetical protein
MIRGICSMFFNKTRWLSSSLKSCWCIDVQTHEVAHCWNVVIYLNKSKGSEKTKGEGANIESC